MTLRRNECPFALRLKFQSGIPTDEYDAFDPDLDLPSVRLFAEGRYVDQQDNVVLIEECNELSELEVAVEDLKAEFCEQLDAVLKEAAQRFRDEAKRRDIAETRTRKPKR